MIKTIIYIGIGSRLGGIFRFVISLFFTLKYGKAFNNFPIGILLVNILGSFLMGLFWAFFIKKEEYDILQLFLLTGFLGGFTTFSTFSYETMLLFQSGEILKALVYSFGSVVLSIIACFSGFYIMNLFVK